jgi:hypothetical protein
MKPGRINGQIELIRIREEDDYSNFMIRAYDFRVSGRRWTLLVYYPYDIDDITKDKIMNNALKDVHKVKYHRTPQENKARHMRMIKGKHDLKRPNGHRKVSK